MARRNPDPGTLPPKAARMLQHVYDSARARWIKKGKAVPKAEEIAARQAWTEVKRYYYEKGGRWHRRKDPLPKGEYPPGTRPAARVATNPELKGGKGRYTVLWNGRSIGKVTKVTKRGPPWEVRTVALVGSNPRTIVEYHPTKEAARDSIVAHHTRTRTRNRMKADVKRKQEHRKPLRHSLASNDLDAIRRKIYK